MNLSTRSVAYSSILLLLCLFRPAASLSCYQQTYTPGQSYYGLSNSNLPKATCGGSSNSCFKMVCFGTTYYTIRGCLDFTQPQYNCQTLATQCPGATGQCYTCNGNNCNGAVSMNASKVFGLLLALPLVLYSLMGKN